MKILGLRGWSGSGKTTLLVNLIPELTRRRLRVSTVKHAHHGFDLDRPGKDSFRHREAGATEVMLASANRFALLHEARDSQPTLDELIARMSPVDLVLVEGFKTAAHLKIEVWREATGQPLLAAEDENVIAIATDFPDRLRQPPRDLPVLALDRPGIMAEFIIGRLWLTRGTS